MIKAILIGHEPERLRAITSGIKDLEVKLESISNAELSPLSDLSTEYQIIILQLGLNWQTALQNAAKRLLQSNQALIVFGDDQNPDIIRQAMKAGARDYLTYQMPENELRAAITNIISRLDSVNSNESHISTSIISANCGNDATFMAANLAYITATLSSSRTLVSDFDFQFSTLPLFLDMQIERTVIEALESIESLDKAALSGYTAKHKSGMELLGPYTDEVTLPGEITDSQITGLVNIIKSSYRSSFLILPRLIDPIMVASIKQSDNIVVVVHQSVASIAIAKKIIRLIHEIIDEHHKLHVLVSEYNPSNRITEADLKSTLATDKIHLLPDDKSLITQCSDIGMPLYEHSKKANLTKSLVKFAEVLYAEEFNSDRGIFKRAVSSLGKLVG